MIKSRRIGWVGNVAQMGDRRDVYRVLVGEPGEKRLLWRPRRRREYNMKTNFQEVGCGVWTRSIWFRIGQVAGTCECSNIPSFSMKCGEFLDWLKTG